MSGPDVKAVCDCVAAIAALFATGFWFATAIHPVGMPGPGFYMPRDSTHSVWAQMAAQGRKFFGELR